MAIMNTSDSSQTLRTDELWLKKERISCILHLAYIYLHMWAFGLANSQCKFYLERQIAQLFQIEDYRETSKKMLNEPL